MTSHSPLRALTLVAVAAVVATAGMGAVSVWRVYDNHRLVSHTYEVKSALDTLLSSVTDAETGQRGFLITGDPAYLEPYQRGTASIQDALREIASLTADDSTQIGYLAELRPVVDQKLRELAQTVEMRRTDGFEAAQQIVRTDVGRATMDRIRAIVDDMDRQENRLLAERRHQSSVSLLIAVATLAAGALSALVLLAFGANVSWRRHAEVEAREQLALRLAAIVESSDDAMIAKDLNGTITAWNAAAERLYGYTANEAIGQSIRIIVPPDRQHEEDEVLARLRRGETIKHFETLRWAKDGRLIEVSLTVSPIKTRSGEIVGASKIARDLTPLRLYATDLEHKVRERTADLEAANARLEAFAFSVAHDLLDASLYAVRDDVQRSGANVDIQPDLPTVRGNRSVLIQVFSNLLSNAVKFGGREPRVRVWSEMREPMAHVWVEDQGIGIAPEHQERIFGVFERLHGPEVYPGTGIGLAIVKKGIERLGGRVGVESQTGHGSRFWVELPRAAA